MQDYLQRLAQHLASFVAVERRHKAKIGPTNRRAVVRVWYRRRAADSSYGLPTWSRTLASKYRPYGLRRYAYRRTAVDAYFRGYSSRCCVLLWSIGRSGGQW